MVDEETQRAILTVAYAEPDMTPAEIARDFGHDEATVESVLADPDVEGVEEAAVATDWDDPQQCPFCGADIPDGGPGFVDHIDDSEPCRLGFERWREGVAGDMGGEWTG